MQFGMDESLSMIRCLTEAKGPSGFEDEAVAAARAHARGNLDVTEDTLRNLYLRRRENRPGRPVVMLDAHTDEVGFMVQAVRPNGTLKFIPLGGWVNSNIPAHRVWVRSRKGQWIPGITAAKPPHFMSAAERNTMPEIADMSIDIGASSPEEVRDVFGIGPGAPVVPDVDFRYDREHDLITAKAMDNRLGCCLVLEVLAALEGEDLPVQVVGALASQEEVGTRGASVTARQVKPDVALVFEGSPADDTVVEDWLSQTRLRHGPMLRHMDARMITHPRFQRFALNTAERLGIPVQEAVRTGGSTNGAPIHLSENGIPCVVIGLPVRYIHSHYGIACLSDYLNARELGIQLIRSLTEDVIGNF